MTMNHKKKTHHIFNAVRLILEGELNCLQECFRKQTGREDV